VTAIALASEQQVAPTGRDGPVDDDPRAFTANRIVDLRQPTADESRAVDQEEEHEHPRDDIRRYGAGRSPYLRLGAEALVEPLDQAADPPLELEVFRDLIARLQLAGSRWGLSADRVDVVGDRCGNTDPRPSQYDHDEEQTDDDGQPMPKPTGEERDDRLHQQRDDPDATAQPKGRLAADTTSASTTAAATATMTSRADTKLMLSR
jgi:hypothetical protein